MQNKQPQDACFYKCRPVSSYSEYKTWRFSQKEGCKKNVLIVKARRIRQTSKSVVLKWSRKHCLNWISLKKARSVWANENNYTISKHISHMKSFPISCLFGRLLLAFIPDSRAWLVTKIKNKEARPISRDFSSCEWHYRPISFMQAILSLKSK